MSTKHLVPTDKLTKRITLDSLEFKTTADLSSLNTVIGQKRAVAAINFALEIDDTGYNLFITGPYGTGRTTIVKDLINKIARKRVIPNDWAFVYNFHNVDEPIAIEFPAGQAFRLRKNYSRMITNLKDDLQKVFQSKNYTTRRNEIVQKIQNTKQEIYSALETEAFELQIKIKNTSMGFVTMPLKDGKPIESDVFIQMEKSEQDRINLNLEKIQKRIQEVVRQLTLLDRTLQDELDTLDKKVAKYVVNNHFVPLMDEFNFCPAALDYLNDAAENLVNSVSDFIEMEQADGPETKSTELPFLVDKYKVNVVKDNAGQTGAPVIYEQNPTYNNLFGRIEKKTYQGYVYTDYTMIKPGSILNANGGYLIIDAEPLLKQNYAYSSLKRALRSRQLRLEDINELIGYSSSTSLRPAAVPLNIKVILIGTTEIFRLLHSYDEEFRKIFKVHADFDYEVKDTSDTIKKYLEFIARVVNEENLLPFDKSAVENILLFSYRKAGHQKMLSLQFGDIVRIIREASFWASKSRKKVVSAVDVRQAIETKIYRHNLVEEKLQDSIQNGIKKVNVSGSVIGQINGLAVYDIGDYSFGIPSRITVNTYIGSKGIVNIEREAKMSGRTHDKGVMILSGYFYQKFGSLMPLSFSASVTFEQSYGFVDGDSASSTELYALISSLSEIPLRQNIAVTGSINQKGEIQAIGGVNEKIEGFYKICKLKGLDGDQGVLIPKSNIPNLLLDSEILQAVQEKRFSIYAIDHIEEGIEILTGLPAGRLRKNGTFTANSVFEKVRLKLVEFAMLVQKFKHNISNHIQTDKTEEEND